MRSAFADQVAELVKTLPDTAMPSGARHPNRVAISEVYEAYRKARPGDYYSQSPANFKTRLVELAKDRLVTLGRADLPERLHPETLTASATVWNSEEVHFIVKPARTQEQRGAAASRQVQAMKAKTATKRRR